MRFGFSDGSCVSGRGSWRFQSPSPKSVENNTFWSLGEMAAEPGVHNSGVWGLKLARRVLPRVLLGRGPPRRGVHNSGVWGLKRADKVLPRVLLGKGPPCGGVHNLGVWALELVKGYSHACCWAGAPSKKTIRKFGACRLRNLGRGPELHGRVVWGPEIAESVNLISLCTL